jgi:glycosyltransferase involved in cell wall biosynthesis
MAEGVVASPRASVKGAGAAGPPKVVISNGFCKFHLSIAAAEASKRGRLARFITGAYPTPFMRVLVRYTGLDRLAKVRRMIAREDEIPDELVSSLPQAEAFYHLFKLLQRSLPRVALWLNGFSFRLAARMSVRHVRRAAAEGARLYHYRAGYGHESVEEARRLGMFCLCDHSIVHPKLLQAVILQGGAPESLYAKGPIDSLWQEILRDIELCDQVLVNSDFVKATFLAQGWPAERVHVQYLGVDDAFLNAIPERSALNESQPLTILFAGGFGLRKGADLVIRALLGLDDVDWRMVIAGGVQADVESEAAEFAKHPRVRFAGFVSRPELARLMCEAEVFLFPSLAEGSARAVFEALACGCYVITTPNAGSIVQDGVHGALLPNGDVEAIREAIRKVAHDRSAAAEIGRRNRELVFSSYRQSGYGDGLAALYDRLLGVPAPQPAALAKQ